MATDIEKKEVGMDHTSQPPRLTEKNEIEFTPEQRHILGQVYQALRGWRSQRLQTVPTAEKEC